MLCVRQAVASPGFAWACVGVRGVDRHAIRHATRRAGGALGSSAARATGGLLARIKSDYATTCPPVGVLRARWRYACANSETIAVWFARGLRDDWVRCGEW